jgi:Cytochrome C oxidase, cbb3-type, subunit III
MRALALAAACLVVLGCGEGGTGLDFERMIDQPRYEPYEPSRVFPSGGVMQPPPEGTVPRSRVVGEPLLTEGMAGGAYAREVPMPVTRRLLERGRGRFDAFCAPCHGVLGDGDSVVAASMALRRPPSLHLPHVRAHPPGRLYQTITRGVGLMPAYGAELSLADRWAVVAYVRALQLSQHATLGRLPDPLRREALEALSAAEPPASHPPR